MSKRKVTVEYEVQRRLKGDTAESAWFCVFYRENLKWARGTLIEAKTARPMHQHRIVKITTTEEVEVVK